MKPVEIMKLDGKINEVCRLGQLFRVSGGGRGVCGALSRSYKVQRAKRALWMIWGGFTFSSFLSPSPSTETFLLPFSPLSLKCRIKGVVTSTDFCIPQS